MATCGTSLVKYIITSGTGTTVNMTLSNGAGPSWKTTNMENNQNGRRPNWNMTQMEDDQNVVNIEH